jgi:N-glycosidase YbiA
MTRLTLDTDDAIYFYEQDYYVFSNFSAFRLNWRAHDFDTSEQAYQWSKFDFFGAGTGAREAADAILKARSAHEAFKIAEANSHHRNPEWNDIKVDVMAAILRAKIDQHPYVRGKLITSGDRKLIENSWRDPYWGWGRNRDGTNMLGQLWMNLRASLLDECGMSQIGEVIKEELRDNGWDIVNGATGSLAFKLEPGAASAVRIDVNSLARRIAIRRV